MIKLLFLLTFFVSKTLYALTPLEGIILGTVSEEEYKLASNFNAIKAGPKIDDIKHFLLSGESYENSCLAPNVYMYIDENAQNVAKSSIVSNLQYLGINLSLRAIVSYAKSLRLSSEKFDHLVTNLVDKSCSDNFSVYSKKLLRNNFHKLFKESKEDLAFKYHHLSLSDSIREEIESKDFVTQSFDYTIRNFRALCSWDGDTTDFRLIGKYLEDRYTMAYLSRFIMSSETPTKILCEDSICREVESKYFLKKVPRVSGTISFKEDMRLLYCNKYSMKKTYSLNPQIEQWQKKETRESKIKEVMNLNALFNGTPNLSLLGEGVNALKDVLEKKVKGEWSEWSKDELAKFSLDLLYEEPLQIDLVNKEFKTEYLQGELGLDFQYSMGELDLLSENLNKLRANFTLKVNKHFVRWFYKNYFQAIEGREFSKIDDMQAKLISVLGESFKEKEKYFNLKMWTKDISKIAAKELIRQLSFYKGKDLEFNAKEEETSIDLKVNLSFGLFALKYFKDKAQLNKLNQTLTSK